MNINRIVNNTPAFRYQATATLAFPQTGPVGSRSHHSLGPPLGGQEGEQGASTRVLQLLLAGEMRLGALLVLRGTRVGGGEIRT